MKRRDFVKGLAALPLAAMAAEIACKKGKDSTVPSPDALGHSQSRPSPTTTKQLNVVVHGMFAIIVDRNKQKKVSLRAPNVPTHIYEAETFSVDPHNPQNPVAGWNYQVTSQRVDSLMFNRGNDPKLDIQIGERERLAIDVSARKAVDNKAFWTVDLPIPDDICGLRAAPANYLSPCVTGNCMTDNSSNPTYRDNEMSIDQYMPLIYVLTYKQIPANETITLGGQAVTFDGGIGRLHFFAEPDTEPTGRTPHSGSHVDDAINELDQLFNPALTLLFWKDKPGPDFGVGRDQSVQCNGNDTVLLCEERSLYELGASCGKFQETVLIDDQYRDFLKVERELGLAERELGLRLTTNQVPTSLFTRKRHKISKKQFTMLQNALPNDAKPPSNCMSLVCIQS